MINAAQVYERMPALGVYPPEPTKNIQTDNFDQAVYVPSERAVKIPLGLQFRNGVNIRRELAFKSEQSGLWEVPYVVSGRNPDAVRARVQAVFQL